MQLLGVRVSFINGGALTLSKHDPHVLQKTSQIYNLSNLYTGASNSASLET